MLQGNPDVGRHAFTAEEYRAMAEAGVLGGDDRVGLLGGEILEVLG